MKRRRCIQIFCYAVAFAAAVLTLFPLYWTLITSFKTYREAFAQPPQFFSLPTLKNYIQFLQQNQILLYLRNSVIISALSVAAPLVLGLFASYAVTRSRLRGKEGFAMFLLASRFIPPVSTLIPTYLLFRRFGLYDTLTGLVLLNAAMNIPYVVYMMRGFIQDVPLAIEESAWLDGAGRMRTFFSVVLPMCRPGIAATAVLSFCFSWNEFMYAMNLTSSNAKTLPLAMMTYMGESGTEWQMMATAGIVILLPTVIFAVLTHRNLGSGMSFGAVKG